MVSVYNRMQTFKVYNFIETGSWYKDRKSTHIKMKWEMFCCLRSYNTGMITPGKFNKCNIVHEETNHN